MPPDPTTTEPQLRRRRDDQHPVVDPTVLGALAARLGERAPGFLGTLLDTWEQEITQRLAELDEAVVQGRPAAVGRVAHSVRGSSAAMGAVRLSEACGEVEVAVTGEADLHLSGLRDRLVGEARRALAELGSLHRG